MKVTVAGAVRHLCPYRDEMDEGTVELTFDVPAGDGPELHGLAAQIDYSEIRLSHEDMTRSLLELTDAQRVVTRWHTAGLDVTCDLSSESVRT